MEPSGFILCNEPLAHAKPIIYAGYGNFKCSKPYGPVEYKGAPVDPGSGMQGVPTSVTCGLTSAISILGFVGMQTFTAAGCVRDPATQTVIYQTEIFLPPITLPTLEEVADVAVGEENIQIQMRKMMFLPIKKPSQGIGVFFRRRTK
ncbi:hypothetical protein HDU67_003794 [Dinochytrium kinnereticum]|nr:hypothetical protein HDU67_003794 [Dinochytrium kinnereticum]